VKAMTIIELFRSFQTDEQAIEYLENIRWRGLVRCPYCGGENCYRHASPDRKHSRWQCYACRKAFAVTVGTIFHGTHIALRDWFLVLALMLNAKKSASSYQIARDVGIRRPTVWRMMHCIRIAMDNDMQQAKLLYGIVEADETYIGGKPRKGKKYDNDDDKPKRGRGTKKTPVMGLMERAGRVVAKVANVGELSAKGLAKFISKYVDLDASLLVTDEYHGYDRMCQLMRHAVIKHKQTYVDGLTHTNTIEGFWAIVKRALYGQHHYYSKKYTQLYISEACYKHNTRKNPDNFDYTLRAMVGA
jgi:transposase-like protein